MPLQIGDLFRILKRRQPKALYVSTIGLTTGFAPDQRQRVMQLVIRDAQAPHGPGGAGLRALQAAASGGAAIRLLAKAVIAEAGNWWRTYTIRRARIAAVRELHALDDRTLRDIGVSRSEIEWVVVHGRPNDDIAAGQRQRAQLDDNELRGEHAKCRKRNRRTRT